MENLRPERDELDQFKNRKGSVKGKAQVVSNKKTAQNKGGSSGMGGVFVLLAIVLVANFALGWGYLTQQKTITDLKSELDSADSFRNQSKLLMARMEGELSETGAVMAESGSAVEKKLAFLDSEMRKLWGVSNDRNRKAIKQNSAEVEALAKKLGVLESEKSALKSQVAKVQKRNGASAKLVSGYGIQLNELSDRVARDVDALKASVTIATSESALTQQLVNEELISLKNSVERQNEIKVQVDDAAKAIASIDESRVQLNGRIVALERQLNELRLKVTGSSAGTVDVP